MLPVEAHDYGRFPALRSDETVARIGGVLEVAVVTFDLSQATHPPHCIDEGRSWFVAMSPHVKLIEEIKSSAINEFCRDENFLSPFPCEASFPPTHTHP